MMKNEASIRIQRTHTKWIFFSLGALNNLCVEMTLCYSNDLAKSFHHDSLMTIFHCVMIVFAILTRLVNARCFLKVKHRFKNLFVVLCFALGAGCMILAFWKNLFILTLLSMVFFGIGTSLGESNNLGFLKGFPTEISASYNSGTGFSGLIGTSFYLLLKIFHFSFYAVNLCILLFYPLYILMFHLACVYQKKYRESESLSNSLSMNLSGDQEPHTQVAVEQEQAQKNNLLNWVHLKKLWPNCRLYFSIFFALYLLEYVSNSWLTSHFISSFTARYDKDNAPFFVFYGFELASVFYRFFLFMGRSSTLIFRFSNIRNSTIILAVIVSFYTLESCLTKVFPLPMMFITLCVIGFIGGVIYSNCIYLLLETQSFNIKNTEIATNLLGTFGEAGMLCSTILGLIFLRLLP